MVVVRAALPLLLAACVVVVAGCADVLDYEDIAFDGGAAPASMGNTDGGAKHDAPTSSDASDGEVDAGDKDVLDGCRSNLNVS